MNEPTLSDILALGEGFTTEFKRSGTSNLGRKICAFANATGGVILIGVADSGEVLGVADHNRLKSEVQSIARSAEPPVAVEDQADAQVAEPGQAGSIPLENKQIRLLTDKLDALTAQVAAQAEDQVGTRSALSDD